MRSTLSAAALFVSALQLASAQTFTDCDPTKKTCPADPGLGTTLTTDFTKGKSDDWTLADGTSLTYGSDGAVFTISTKTNAPTVTMKKYIMFGKITVNMKASPGQGIVSSFILESDDLDEIDWEWLGSTDTSVESNFFGKGDTTTYDRAIYHPMSQAISGWHTYTIDWTKDSIQWIIDGKTVRTLTYNDPLTHGGKNYPQTPMQVKMGSWVGCADAAAAADPKTKGTCEWAGGPADFTKGPFNMLVKSVTVQDYGCGGDYTYSDMTGSYQSIKSSGKCDGKGTSDSSSSSSASSTASSSASSSGSKTVSSTASSTSGSSTGSTVATPSSTAISTGSSSGNTTTLATSPTPSATQAGSGSSATTSGTTTTQSTVSGASALKPKHSYGALDFGVIVLGLGLGYLVM
ncbi:concanavalin A-like lectin/glucanase domain-containing protein [Tricladium varicosporioides]|nr:concanavalin A-like lectin/glucanase domain-containing protein [Hymenoscyphus varicosporioides]